MIETEPQQENIIRRVLAFAQSRQGQEFYMRELLTYVRLRFPTAAPDSPGRILRLLRQVCAVEYHVVDRAVSLYHVDKVRT